MLQHHGRQIYGDERHQHISSHLFSAFETTTVPFSLDNNTSYKQLENIYDKNITRSYDYTRIWENYTDSFSMEEVASAIESTESKSDPGPMSISLTFIKFNIEKLLPLIHHYNMELSRRCLPINFAHTDS